MDAPLPSASPTQPVAARRGRPYAGLVPGVFVGCCVPAATLLMRAEQRTLSANPIAELLNQLGLAALILLIACIACTPLRIVTG